MDLGANISSTTMKYRGDVFPGLETISDVFIRMMLEDVLPVWSVAGMDRADGGFSESLAADGSAPAVPRRVRVSARQMYAFCEASRLGWNNMAATACLMHGYDFLVRNANEDGLIHHSVSIDGDRPAEGHDLYDQAFLLFAYANAYRHQQNDEFRQRGRALLAVMRRVLSLPGGGFADHTQRPFPLRSNPHMHLLEAALAWMEVDDEPSWRALADEIVTLFKTRLFDPEKGVVREMFMPDWSAIEEDGRCRIEPGHNYEWAWLLIRWQKMTGGEAGDCAERMIDFAETYGYDPVRHVAINEFWSDGCACETTARLWPQTERLKAWLAIAEGSHGLARWQAERRALDAAGALLRYMQTGVPGMWYDLMLENGSFRHAAAPASSFYHIICAVGELARYVDRPQARASNIDIPPPRVSDAALLELTA